MICQTLTLKSIQARPVVLKLKRPVAARMATLIDWPLILIDLYTEEGVIGRAYLKPYIRKSMRYLIPALHDRLPHPCGDLHAATAQGADHHGRQPEQWLAHRRRVARARG